MGIYTGLQFLERYNLLNIDRLRQGFSLDLASSKASAYACPRRESVNEQMRQRKDEIERQIKELQKELVDIGRDEQNGGRILNEICSPVNSDETTSSGGVSN